jgi:cytochrome c
MSRTSASALASRDSVRSICKVNRILLAAGLGVLSISSLAAAEARPKSDAVHGQQLYARCSACHTIGQSGGKMGPTLNGVVGRKAGAVAGYTYSPAMTKSGLTWNMATLAHFLEAPSKLVPGTKMFFPGFASPQDQADIVAYLKQYRADGGKK